MLFQPIVINHWYFIRHLKRWMICANEISIIYGGHKKLCAKARQHIVFLLFLPSRRGKNLIYDLFSSYFICRRESFSCAEREREAFRKKSLKVGSFSVAHENLRLSIWSLLFNALQPPRKKGRIENLFRRNEINFDTFYMLQIKLLEFMT